MPPTIGTRTDRLDTLVVGVVERYAERRLLDQISVADPFFQIWAGRDTQFSDGLVPEADLTSLREAPRDTESGLQMVSPSGEFIKLPLRAARAGTSKGIGSYGTFDTTTPNPNREAYYRWRTVGAPVSYSMIDDSRIGNANEVQEYIMSIVNDMKEDALHHVREALYGDGSGSNSKDPLGLQAIVADDPTTGTLGGVDRSDAQNAFYQNQFKDHTGNGDFDQEQVEQVLLSATRGVHQPRAAFTDKVTWRKVWKATLPQERTLRINGLRNLGTRHILMDGQIPLMFSEFCPDQTMYLLSKRALKIYINRNLAGRMAVTGRDWPVDGNQPQVKKNAWLIDMQMCPLYPKELGVVFNIGVKS